MAGESQRVPESEPDPTVLVTEAIDRAIRAERDYQLALHQLIDAENRATNQRVNDLDVRLRERYEQQEKAVALRADTLAKEFHEHLEQVRHETALAFVNSDRAIAAALNSQEKAVDKAEAANEKRFESVNEFRAQLNDQAATFIARPEYNAGLNALNEKLAAIEKIQDREVGHASGIQSGWAYLVAAGGLVLTIVSIAAAIIIATR